MDTDDLVAALEQLTVGSVSITTRALAEAGPGVELTLQQWRALLVLGDEEAGARIGTVARRVGVTVPATSRLLRRLERRGLVDLATDDADRRATRVRLTDEGQLVRVKVLDSRRAALRGIAAAVDPTARVLCGSMVRTLADEFGRHR